MYQSKAGTVNHRTIFIKKHAEGKKQYWHMNMGKTLLLCHLHHSFS